MCNWQSWIWPGIAVTGMLTALAFWFQVDISDAGPAISDRPAPSIELPSAAD